MAIKRKQADIASRESSSPESSNNAASTKRQRTVKNRNTSKSPSSDTSNAKFKPQRVGRATKARCTNVSTIFAYPLRQRAERHLKKLLSTTKTSALAEYSAVDEQSGASSCCVCDITVRHALANLQQIFKLPKTTALQIPPSRTIDQLAWLTKIVGQPGVPTYSRQIWFRMDKVDQGFEVDEMIRQVMKENKLGEGVVADPVVGWSDFSFLMAEIVRMLVEQGSLAPRRVSLNEDPMQGRGWRTYEGEKQVEDRSQGVEEASGDGKGL